LVVTTLLDGLAGPRGLAVDANGNLFFTEEDARRVRRRDAVTGEVTSVGDGAWNIPRGIRVNARGDVFVADTGRQQIMMIPVGGTATPIAGTGSAGFSGDGGAAASAQLGFPWDVAIADGSGSTTNFTVLLIADLDNNRVRKLSPMVAGAVLFPQVRNAANHQVGAVAPGMLVELAGGGLAGLKPDAVQVLFNSLPATVVSVNDQSVVLQVPSAVAPGDVSVTISLSGAVLPESTAKAVVAAPALFGVAGQASAINENGTLNSAENPAARGSVIALYGTGEGVGNPAFTVSIGGAKAEVLYGGPAPGYPGVFQVNARIPSSAGSGGQAAVATVNGVSSAGDMRVVVR
jgi:uncharacterized protein (TIGR03437 family)